MKAIKLQGFGGVENLVATEIATPQIADNEVLVKVKAISLNPVDAKTRAGKGMAGRMKDLDPLILGWDIAGIVAAKGKNVTQFKEGDEVFGMVNFPGHGQAYAEYVAAPEAHLALKPANISFAEAGAATLAALTAWQALVTHAKIKAGDKVLVHAAAGGVGHYAVQIARHFGAFVVGTSSAENKCLVLQLGANEHIDYKSQAFEEAVKGADIVLDTIGGTNAERSLLSAKKGGTVITIPSGSLTEKFTKEAAEKGVNGFFFLVQSNGEDMRHIAGLLAKGIIRSQVSAAYCFEEMGKAHLQIESGKTKGKIVVLL